MALLSGNRIAWTYTDEEGNDWRVAAQKALTDQAVLGGSAAAGSVPQKPRGLKMRRVTVSNGTYSTVLHVYDNAAPIRTRGTSVNANRAGDSRAMTSNGGVIPEDSGRKNVTKQST